MSKTRVLIAVLTVLSLVLTAGGCKSAQPADVIVASPHKEHIEADFARAFSDWHQKEFGRPVKVEWRNIGGTTQITQYIKAQYERSDSAGIDVFFGGGAPGHVALAKRGLLVPIDLPAETAAQIPAEIGGVRQRDPSNRWIGACVSSFVILTNAKLAEQKSLPVPARWTDLADARMLGLVTAAGPKSGSGLATYELILQSAPTWPEGWRLLLTIWGNCKSFTQGASDVPNQVANGEVIAGTCIDYYAFNAIAQNTPGMLTAAVPVDSVVFTPDPISILKGAPNAEMASRFVRFVLSAEGQALWCLPAGVAGGPAKQAMSRQPIRKDVYTRQAGRMLKELTDIYALESDFELDVPLQEARISYILPRLMRAAAIDNAENLRQARRKIVKAGAPADLVATFAELPANLATRDALLATASRIADLEAAGDARAIETIEADWREFWRKKYQSILD